MQFCYKSTLLLFLSGLPKAAVVTHLKAVRAWAGVLETT